MKQHYLLIFLYFISLLAFAQVPPNDEIQNAVEIINFPFTDSNVQTQNATTASSGGMSGGCDIGNSLTRVYYKINVTGNRSFRVKLSNGDNNSFILFYKSNSLNPTADSQLDWVPGFIAACGYNQDNSVTTNSPVPETLIIVVGNPNQKTNILIADISDYNDANIVNIPDPNFKTALINHTNPVIDTNGDNEIQVNEAFFSDKLLIGMSNISDLAGIEAFVNLETLYCNSNIITSLDTSSNLQLKLLSCRNNDLTSLNISQNLNLNTLWADKNPNLGNIDLTSNLNLEKLSLFDCSINDSFDMSNNVLLEELNLDTNNINNIDLTSNLALQNVILSFNNISSIDVSQNSFLVNLEIRETNISTLDLNNNSLLEKLNIQNTQITSLDLSQNVELKFLNCSNLNLPNLDISGNPNLLSLQAYSSNINALDVSQNIILEKLAIPNNNITNLDLSNSQYLIDLSIDNNPISSIDLSQNSILTLLNAPRTSLQTIDLSNNSNLKSVILSSNEFLQSIYLKNSNNIELDGTSGEVLYPSGSGGVSFTKQFRANNNPNLEIICVDDVGFATINFIKDATAIFVEDCTITNVDYNIIQGIITFDDDNNGCDTNDINVPNQLIKVTDGVNDYGTFTNSNGQYAIDVVENTYTTTVENLPSYVTAMPNSFIDTFTGYGTTETADFCLTANQGNINDVNVVILPTNQARPGFLANYQLVIENTSILPVAGEVTFSFNNGMQTFVNANPSENTSTSNSITFTYSDLQPFEIRTIDLVMNTFTPPTVNGGDILSFTATITPINEDQNQNDNIFVLEQVVVNSYDPNDKTVLQGSEIGVEKVDEYLNYIIRFQNTGTASAINVVITDQLDNDLDWTTLKPVSSSDSYQLRVINGDFLEFKFENINLPAQIDDDSGSQGFVAFKIKPKPEVTVGDFITGWANIYFDYNTPIITNRVSTEVVATLSVSETEMFNDKIRLYPNPVTIALKIKISSGDIIESVLVYNISGQLLLKKNGNIETIDLTAYEPGIYFVKLITNKGEFNNRIIKK